MLAVVWLVLVRLIDLFTWGALEVTRRSRLPQLTPQFPLLCYLRQRNLNISSSLALSHQAAA